jgi:hypothetical protein
MAGLTSSATTAAPRASSASTQALPIPEAGASDECDFAGVGERLAGEPQLRLLEAPVFDVEQVLRRQRHVAAERGRARDHVDRMRVDFTGDRRVLRRAADGAYAELGVEHDARRRVEHRLALRRRRLLRCEIAAVVLDVRRDVASQHGHAFRADHVIGRDRALLRDCREIGPPAEREAARVGVARDDHRESGGVGDRLAKAARDRARRRRSRVRAPIELPRAVALEVGLGAVDQLDHPIVGFARGRAE